MRKENRASTLTGQTNSLAAGSTGATAVKRGQVNSCQLCQKKFGTFMKEHQCKRCSRAVCDDCSKSKSKIIGYEVKPNVAHRICKHCKEESDFQNELRSKNSLSFGTNSQIAIKWCQCLDLINDKCKEQDLRVQFENQQVKNIDVKFSYNSFRRELNFSHLEFIHYICIKEGEEKLDLLIKNIIQKLAGRLGWIFAPPKIDHLIFYLLSFGSDYVTFHIICHLYERMFPEYVMEYLTNSSDDNMMESEIWNSARQVLNACIRETFGFNDVETKAVNAFILNEGREMISTMMINDITFQSFHHTFEEMMSAGKFEEWEKSFIALVKFNLNSIKGTKVESKYAILRNTRIMEIKKIKKDYENQLRDISQKINKRSGSMIKFESNNELEKLREQLEHKERELSQLKTSTIDFTPKSFMAKELIGESADGDYNFETVDKIQKQKNELEEELNKMAEEHKQNSEIKNKQIEDLQWEIKNKEEREKQIKEQMENDKNSYQSQINDLKQKLENSEKQIEINQSLIVNQQNSSTQKEEEIQRLYENMKNEKEKISLALEQKEKGHALIISNIEEQLKIKESQLIDVRKVQENEKIKLTEMIEKVEELKRNISEKNAKEAEIIKKYEEEIQIGRQNQEAALSEKLKQWEIKENGFNQQLKELNEKISNLEQIKNEEKKNLMSQNSSLQANLLSLETKLKAENEKLLQAEQQMKKNQMSSSDLINEQNQKIIGFGSQVETLLLEISALKESNKKLKEIEIQNENLQSQNKKIEIELNKKSLVLQQAEGQEKELKKKLKELEEKIQEQESSYSNLQQGENEKQNLLKQEMASMAEKLKEIENQGEKRKDKIGELEKNLSEMQLAKSALEEQMVKQKSEFTQLELTLSQEREKNKEAIANMKKQAQKEKEEFENQFSLQKEQHEIKIRETLEANSGKELQEQIEQIKEQYSKQNKELSDKCNEFSQKLETEKQEREKEVTEMKEQLQQKGDSIHSMIKNHEEEVINQKKQFESEKDKLTKQFNDEKSELEKQVHSKEAQLVSFQNQLSQLQQDLQEKEKQKKSAEQENQKLNRLIENQIAENITQVAQVTKQYEEKINSLSEENNLNVKNIETRHAQEKESFVSQIAEQEKQFQVKISSIQEDLSKKSKQLEELNKQLVGLEEEKGILRQQILSLQEEKQKIELENKQKLSELEENISAKEKQIEEIKKNHEISVQKIQTELNSKIVLIDTTNAQLLQSKSKVEEYKNLYSSHKADLEKQIQICEERELNFLKQEKEWKEKLDQKNQTLSTFYENQSQISQKNDEIQQQRIKQYEQQIAQLQSRHESDLQALQNKHNTEISSSEQKHQQEIKQLESKHKQQEAVNEEQIRQQKQQLEQKHEYELKQIEAKNNEQMVLHKQQAKEQKEKLEEEHNLKIQSLQQEIAQKEGKISQNMIEITQLQQQLEAVNNEKKESTNRIVVLEKETAQLKQKLTEIKNPEETQNQKDESIIKQQEQQIAKLHEEVILINNQKSQFEQEVKQLKLALQNSIKSANDLDSELGNNNVSAFRNSYSAQSIHESESSHSLNVSPTHIPRLNMTPLSNRDTSEFISPRGPASANSKLIELQLQVKSLENKNKELKESLNQFHQVQKINSEMKKLLEESRKSIKELETELSHKETEIQQKESDNENMKSEIQKLKETLNDFESFEEKLLEMRMIDMNRFEQVSDKIDDLKEVSQSKIELVNIIQMFALNFKKELDDRNDKIKKYLKKIETTSIKFREIQEQHEEMEQLLLSNKIDISHIIENNQQNLQFQQNSLYRSNSQSSDIDRRSISSDLPEFAIPNRVRPSNDPNLARDHNTTCTGGDCNIF